jgi:hypothetical protein
MSEDAEERSERGAPLGARHWLGPRAGLGPGAQGACSSVGQSARLISVRSAVQIGPGPPIQMTEGAGAGLEWRLVPSGIRVIGTMFSMRMAADQVAVAAHAGPAAV